MQKWRANIRIDGKVKHLGYLNDEMEATCKYVEQATLLNKPMNFSQHESREQALKRVSKVSDPEYEYMSTGGRRWKQNNTKMKMMTMMMRT